MGWLSYMRVSKSVLNPKRVGWLRYVHAKKGVLKGGTKEHRHTTFPILEKEGGFYDMRKGERSKDGPSVA